MSGRRDGIPAEIVAAMGGREPTPQQWHAIRAPLSARAIVAGAGSGKTAVMAARVVYLALAAAERVPGAAGVLPSRVLCLTFTNKAAEELARRVRDATLALRLPEGEEATVLTYHAFAARLLEEEGLRMGLEPAQMLLSAAHRWQIARTLFEDRTFEHLQIRTVAHPVRMMLDLADACANHLVDPAQLAAWSRAFAGAAEVRNAGDREAVQTALQRAELADLVVAFEERKRSMHAIDYGDQIALAYRLAAEHPAVGETFRERYPVVLLDEYQDTNHAQGRLLSLLCPPGHPVMCVGDPDQNIYAWRGASLRNILRFAGEFGGEELPLSVNFRSGRRILDVANAVIERVPAERRAAGKRLDPHPPLGDGEVLAFVAEDEREEARRIARIALERREAGTPFASMAVLCRKKRLMPAIAEILRDAGVPVEVVDLGGLLQLPEVVEIVAWLRLLDDPAANVSLARLLQGPRWRIGYRDLVALARWGARHNHALREGLRVDEHPADVAFALVESLDHLDDDDMTGLSGEARWRLAEFRSLLADLRARCAGPLEELAGAIAERSGLLRELEWRASAAAVSARRNVLNFVAIVAGFAPVEGEATLSSLVEYLDTAIDAEEDLEQAQLSHADTVKLLTIHKAKGLEWDVVFVPGLVEGRRSSIFPDTSGQANEISQAKTLPFALRGDREVLPRYEGKLAAFKDALRERALEEERRLCYVALTRARRTLVASAAWWYEGPKEPFAPGAFFEEIRAHPAVEVIGDAPCPEQSPLVEVRRARVPRWPAPARTHPPLPFTDADADPAARARFRARGAAATGEDAGTLRPVAPAVLSVSAVLTLGACPRTFWDRYVRPVPQRPSIAARTGTDVHRWIEMQHRGAAATAFDPEAAPDLDPSERAEPSETSRLRQSWRDSRFARMRPLHVERPFILMLDGTPVRGRIDAIFERDDGGWEIVDYKTGRGDPDPVQLHLYAAACEQVWGRPSTLTFADLAHGREIAVEPASPPAIAGLIPRERPAHDCPLCR